MPETIRAPDGLYGVAVSETGVSRSSADGSLTFRGYPIKELVDNATFEECAFLILEGKLPTRGELEGFEESLRRHSRVPGSVYDMVRNLPPEAHLMDVLRTAVSALGAIEGSLPPRDQQYSLMAKMPALAANCYRLSKGLETVEPSPDLGEAANLLYMIRGRRPEKLDAWAFERELILYLEHDLNASTFTVRVVASTLADVYASSTAGLAALKGPLHGGANEAAMEMLLEIGSAENAERYVRDALANGKKVMGFGHRIYKKVDPRSQLSKEVLKRLVDERGEGDDLYRLCDATATAMWNAKKIPTNLDFYAAPIFYTLSIPIPLYTPIFASSRIVGWIAHYNEQLAHNKLFRPDSVYVGPSDLAYVPIDKR
jgi:citrate synthase